MKASAGNAGTAGGLRRQSGVSEGRHVAHTPLPRPPASWERVGASGCVTATSRRAPCSPSDPGRVGPRKVSRADKGQEGHPAGRGTQAQPPGPRAGLGRSVRNAELWSGPRTAGLRCADTHACKHGRPYRAGGEGRSPGGPAPFGPHGTRGDLYEGRGPAE